MSRATTRRRTVGACALLALAAAVGCGGDDEAGSQDDDLQAGARERGADGPLGAHPCDAADTDALADALADAGVEGDLSDGTPTVAARTDGDIEWNPDACRWEIGSITVALDVAGADDFADGEVECPPLVSGADPEPIEDLGDQAEWGYQTDIAEGMLRACTERALVDVDVYAQPISDALGPDDARSVAEAVAVPIVDELS